jgi:hypothetical protein
MNWIDLVETAFAAGVGSALVQICMLLYLGRRQRQTHAAYMAMRLAVILEAFASSCSDFIQKNMNAYQAEDREFPDWDAKLPELGPYPEDSDGWRAIDRKLAGRSLGLRNKIAESQSLISFLEKALSVATKSLEERKAERAKHHFIGF